MRLVHRVRRATPLCAFVGSVSLGAGTLTAQIIEFDRQLRPGPHIAAEPTATFLGVAGIEAMTTAMQASSQLIRVKIGEGRFTLPFFFYIGAAGSAWGASGPKAALANILNPLSGNFNLRVTNGITVTPPGHTTLLRLSYDFGAKQFTATDTSGGGAPLFIGSAQGGFRFETKAEAEGKDGLAYLQAMAGGLQNGTGGSFQRLFGPGSGDRLGTLAVDAGIDIKDVLQVKFSLYKTLKAGTGTVLGKSILKLGFDYHPAKTP